MGLFDHCMVHLFPTYRQKLKSALPVVRTVKRWTAESKLGLQVCFDCTDRRSIAKAAAMHLQTD